MQRAEPIEADDRVALVEHGAQALGCANVVARRQQVARVEAQSEPLVAAGELDHLRELLERASERAAGAGGVLELQLAALGLVERLGDRRGSALERRVDRAALRRSGMQDDAVEPERGS